MTDSEDKKKALINEIGATILPELYGGNAELTLLQDVKLAPYEAVLPWIVDD